MRDEDAGEGFLGDTDEGVVLIVAHEDVVAGVEFFDELRLADERFDLGSGFLECDMRCLTKHSLYLRGMAGSLPEIRNQALPDVGGLADIERHLPAAEDVDARVRGDVLRAFHHFG